MAPAAKFPSLLLLVNDILPVTGFEILDLNLIGN
jgi:hypothetical protein